ncbi:MAG TPA: hypothetical protein VFS40_03730 [Gemmatimonadales bacterium]|nr:hypothetical protein [Gemmatimonadales bacterium]
MSARRGALAALVLCGALVLPVPAHAQFGGLGKKLGKKIAGDKAAQAAGISDEGGRVQTGSVKFDESVVEITPAALDRLLKGLAAEQQVAAKMDAQDLKQIDRQNEAAQKAYEKQQAVYEKQHGAWEKCADKERAGMEQESAALQAEGAVMADSAKMEAFSRRMQAAHQRGDMAEVRRLADSVSRGTGALSQRANAAGQRAQTGVVAKCGAEPQAPEAPNRTATLTYSDVQDAGRKASGFDGQQYRILRERIAPYVLSNGKNSVPFVYTKNELAALQSRLDALAPYGNLLRNY